MTAWGKMGMKRLGICVGCLPTEDEEDGIDEGDEWWVEARDPPSDRGILPCDRQ